MFGSWCTLASPGSAMTFCTSQMIQPRSSSTTYQLIGNDTIELPGKVVIVETIHFRIASRPWNRP